NALNVWAFAHTVVRRVDDDEVLLAPIEAVILSKLRYYQMGKSGSRRQPRPYCIASPTDPVRKPSRFAPFPVTVPSVRHAPPRPHGA
ncbi:MAG: hypothetical protein M3Q93_06270, partial [Gemmatimonadota bacterium]|nr:hypothetical protein [Gemmatimonadota bacterium]